MKQRIKLLLLSDEGEHFCGIGVSELLHHVEQTGSLNQASKKMQMSYNKACRMVNKIERVMGFRFIERTSGGKNGGGSVLTAEGKDFLLKYDTYYRKMQELSEEIFQQTFRL